MAVRGRNLANDARAAFVRCAGTGAIDFPAAGPLAVAARSSIQVDEFGVTVVGCAPSGTADSPEVIQLRFTNNDGHINPEEAGTVFATCTVPTGTAYGSEFTTRDGTIAWASGYANAADRVFQKGVTVHVSNSAASHNADGYMVFVASHEYGAPPA